MGDGQLLSNKTNIPIIYDFRSNDMEHGGQGAPFLPVYHHALTHSANLDLPIVILNLGGVGNITWISHGKMIAFDTGPANAMIDDCIQSKANQPYDDGGKIAKSGIPQLLIIDDFFKTPLF